MSDEAKRTSPEAVRLVIWDLDETFWDGTLTEGGIRRYIQEHHDIVVELARRGIMSSICSKNNYSDVAKILSENGILDYFIFPSISWEPKGLRLQKLIDSVQLRAPTVMFIDDNPNNRAEAAALVPGLQIESEQFIASILNDIRFKGKDDSNLTRLKQYKLLEKRKKDEEETTGGNEEFLRNSNVNVYIEYNIEPHIDRAIELINRTNQLNYTKRRLPDDIELARKALLEEIKVFSRQAGLIRVFDKYGDYGWVGFFVTETLRKTIVPGAANSHFRHYCFSCRTLGMLVEKWVYDHLRQPEIEVAGEVLTDLIAPRKIDWINLSSSAEQASTSPAAKVTDEFVLAGGCEMNAVSVYLGAYSNKLRVFGNYTAGGLFVRLNSVFSVLSLISRSADEFRTEAGALDIPLELSACDIFADTSSDSVFVFNFGQDCYNHISYRHKTKGWHLTLEPRHHSKVNFVNLNAEELKEVISDRNHFKANQIEQIMSTGEHIRVNYQLAPPPSEQQLTEAMHDIIARVPDGSKLIIIIDHDRQRTSPTETRILPSVVKYAALIRDIATNYPYVGIASFSDAIISDDEVQVGAGNHYDRQVYLRLANLVADLSTALPPKDGKKLTKAAVADELTS